jgi:hypothetical protein
MRWVGSVARMGEERKMYKVLVEKIGGKRPLGRTRPKWKEWIRMDLGEIGWGMWSEFNWLVIVADGGFL